MGKVEQLIEQGADSSVPNINFPLEIAIVSLDLDLLKLLYSHISTYKRVTCLQECVNLVIQKYGALTPTYPPFRTVTYEEAWKALRGPTDPVFASFRNCTLSNNRKFHVKNIRPYTPDDPNTEINIEAGEAPKYSSEFYNIDRTEKVMQYPPEEKHYFYYDKDITFWAFQNQYSDALNACEKIKLFIEQELQLAVTTTNEPLQPKILP
jgi:hypothetical protein